MGAERLSSFGSGGGEPIEYTYNPEATKQYFEKRKAEKARASERSGGVPELRMFSVDGHHETGKEVKSEVPNRPKGRLGDIPRPSRPNDGVLKDRRQVPVDETGGKIDELESDDGIVELDDGTEWIDEYEGDVVEEGAGKGWEAQLEEAQRNLIKQLEEITDRGNKPSDGRKEETQGSEARTESGKNQGRDPLAETWNIAHGNPNVKPNSGTETHEGGARLKPRSGTETHESGARLNSREKPQGSEVRTESGKNDGRDPLAETWNIAHGNPSVKPNSGTETHEGGTGLKPEEKSGEGEAKVEPVKNRRKAPSKTSSERKQGKYKGWVDDFSPGRAERPSREKPGESKSRTMRSDESGWIDEEEGETGWTGEWEGDAFDEWGIFEEEPRWEREVFRERTPLGERLAELRERKKEISGELSEATATRDALTEMISGYEDSLERVNGTYNDITNKIETEEAEIRSTKNGLMQGLTRGLEIVKNLALGKHDEIRRILHGLDEKVEKNETAMERCKDLRGQLSVNRDEWATIKRKQNEAIEERAELDDKITRLRRERKRLKESIELLKEESFVRREKEFRKEKKREQKEKQRELLETIGGNGKHRVKNAEQARERLDEHWDNVDLAAERKIEEIRDFVNHPVMRQLSPEEARKFKKAAREAEEKVSREHAERVKGIREDFANLDRYFPTLGERLEDMSRNGLVKGALSALKRKMLLRMRGLI